MDVDTPHNEPVWLGDDAPAKKNKGGRKPIHSAEQRKQRNRAAQAAFRERRTEYIQQLEEQASARNADFQRLQKAHTQASEECLMLRYKNSLLERILLEKGVNVQAELRMKEDVQLDPMTFVPKRQKTTIITAPVNLKSTRRPSHAAAKRISRSPPAQIPSPRSLTNETHPASASTTNSASLTPVNSEPLVLSAPDVLASSIAAPYQPQPQSIAHPPQPISSPNPPPKTADSILKRLSSSNLGSAKETAAFYLSSFLAHIETLEKEAAVTNLSPDLNQQAQPVSTEPQIQASPDCQIMDDVTSNKINTNAMNFAQPKQQFHGSFDQMLYSDPFGLDTSLEFPTQFNF